MKTLRLILAGTPQFAADIFQPFLNDPRFDIVAVFTQPDRRSGRGKKMMASPVKQLALEHQLPVYQPHKLNEEGVVETIETLQPDIMIVVAYGQILSQHILTIPIFGCINVHASLLPRWRGAAPIHRSIENGDSESGITIMQMDEGLDTGDMLLQLPYTIADDETTQSLHQQLTPLGIDGLEQVLVQIMDNTVTVTSQDNQQATYAHKITNEEAQIDWRQSAEVIQRKIRAFHPAPGAFCFIDDVRCKLGETSVETDVLVETTEKLSVLEGTIIKVDKTTIKVQCGERVLAIKQLQLPGKKMLSCKDVLQGHAAVFITGKCFQ